MLRRELLNTRVELANGVRSGARYRRRAGRVRGGCGLKSAGRTLLRPMRSAPRSRLIERRQDPARRDCDHETDDHHDRHRRWSHVWTRRAGRGPQGRIRARRMGHAGVRRRGHDVSQPGLRARRRVPVRQADLRDLRRLLGIMGRSGRQRHLDGVEHTTQVRRIDHTQRPEVGEHDRPLRRPRGGHRRAESRAGG